ncbi:MAG: hypothetical protein K2O08_03330 [Clostridia bacterium]|nr:hypothetical protein [Clostridia bacterium]
MKKIVSIICILLAISLLLTCIMGIATNGFKTSIKDLFNKSKLPSGSGITDNNGNEIGSGVYEMPSALNLSAMAFEQARANGQNYVEFSLTATVLPEDATNKLVDWSVAWADGSTSPNVNDYLTTTPIFDGSRNVVIRCYQAFEKDINITVTTRENNCVATCVAHYVGTASRLEVSFDGVQQDSDGNYVFTTATDYSAKLNIVSSLGETMSLDGNFEYYIEDTPNDMVGMVEYKSSYSTYEGYKYELVGDGPNASSCMWSEVFKMQNGNSFSFSNGKLNFRFSAVCGLGRVISSDGSGTSSTSYAPLTPERYEQLSDYYSKQGTSVPGYQMLMVKLQTNEDVFKRPLTLRIVEKNTNLTTSITFKVVKASEVNSVSLSQSELTF